MISVRMTQKQFDWVLIQVGAKVNDIEELGWNDYSELKGLFREMENLSREK